MSPEVAERYDVVIVGAGSAGCVLAARLSAEPGRSVLLLEAGPVAVDEASYPEVLRDERTFPQDHLWRYEGFHGAPDAAPAVIVRGRVLGGSGAVNGMIWQRGLPEDYDGWGLPEWSAARMAEVFDRLEDDLDARGEGGRPSRSAAGPPVGDPSHEGDVVPVPAGSLLDHAPVPALDPVPDPGGPPPGRGPVPVARLGREHWAPSHVAFHDALRDLGVPENPDLLRAEHQGVGAYARNGSDGRRMGAALTHLMPALGRPNLTVRGDVQVARVAVAGGRAVGVDVALDGRDRRIAADEVVLCAGAVETPQLLMHSGIGDPETLRGLGIEVVAGLPGVGRGLTDHPSVVVAVRLREEVRAWDLRCLVGHVATSTVGAAAGLRSDLQTLVMSGPYVGTNGGHAPLAPDPEAVDCILNPILYAPESVGRVEVVGVDPGVRPRIHYDYLRSPGDRARLREALRTTAGVLAHPAFAELVGDAAGAPDAATLADDDRLDAWMVPALRSTLHGCGTCRMGPDADPGAVVDARCRVRGVAGLSVVDLSVVPRVPSAPTNATAMALADRVADWL